MNVAVVGLQWGDEGKGKVVDLLAAGFHIVARYQGGHNAGHTVYLGDTKCVVHHIPAGIFHEGIEVVLGNGMVIDVIHLMKELKELNKWGIPWLNRLRVSNRAHLITPLHRYIETWEENFLGQGAIGTTRRGIGPCYQDKYGRRGLVLGDLLQDDWEARCDTQWRHWKTLYGPYDNVHAATVEWKEFLTSIQELRPILFDIVMQTDSWLRQRLSKGSRILFEGAQGTLLDIDHGTYPFVTASHCSVGGIPIGLGVSLRSVHHVIGVSKAYTTRVGAGPFPTELLDDEGTTIRERGQEYGATTGRPRRCGWLDLVALKYACDINDVDGIVITKLDILDVFDTLKVCIKYYINETETTEFPVRAEDLALVKPIYDNLPGWSKQTYGINRADDLPQNARNYIRYIENYTGRRVIALSSGPRRHETAWFEEPTNWVSKK